MRSDLSEVTQPRAGRAMAQTGICFLVPRFPLTVAISQEEPPIQTPAPALEHSVPCIYAGETHLGLYLLLGVHVLMSSPLSSEKVPMRMECEQSEPGLDRRCVALPSKSIA